MFNQRKNLKLVFVLFAFFSFLALLLIAGCKVNKVSNTRRILSNGNENSATGKVTLTWDEVSNATSYNLYYSELPGVTKHNGNKIPDVPNPATVPNLTRGTTYYFVVTAENSHGESGESNEVSYFVE